MSGIKPTHEVKWILPLKNNKNVSGLYNEATYLQGILVILLKPLTDLTKNLVLQITQDYVLIFKWQQLCAHGPN